MRRGRSEHVLLVNEFGCGNHGNDASARIVMARTDHCLSGTAPRVLRGRPTPLRLSSSVPTHEIYRRLVPGALGRATDAVRYAAPVVRCQVMAALEIQTRAAERGEATFIGHMRLREVEYRDRYAERPVHRRSVIGPAGAGGSR